ncbi:hypothetical protein EKO27_g6630 [Xylaria grammica]|uniref:Zn(2)-C6 fungal-type domain-containing protein n=1 Tax=Xylaria grammica TaxID=363999 RepID=A0A439D243_9PEZI|nr:hypothetical protein EKO27_g6630 [Xylaria grammica]
MNRRTHKKSRLGCRECKRRHIKCDEKRPTCAHCSITHRECQYVSSSTATAPPSATTESVVASPASTHRSDEAPSPGFDVPSRAQPQPRIILRPPDTHWTGELSTPSPSSAPGGIVNMNHMEFLLHYKFSIAIPELDNEFDSVATPVTNKIALKFPWLLHAILAISSRHMAVLNPEKSSLYLFEAFQLQNQAISIFNSEQLHIDETNCSAALLFSSILGRHMLVDTLAGLESDGSVLLDNYCHYVQVHRGLRTIASDSWQLLSESEIWPFLLFTGYQRARKAHGTDLADLRRWVQESQGLDEETLEVCLEAVDLLQAGLDEISSAKTHLRRYQMSFIWSVCNRAKFNDLVIQRLPQALVILAHYTALLHHSQSVWQVRDAGYRFLHTICSVLGPSYESQLWWVRNLVFGSGNRME